MPFNIAYICLVAGIWNVTNGCLHTGVILSQKTKYDRDLLRLLLDGLILVTCGVIQALEWRLLVQTNALVISIVSTITMLIYCALIFPFLKSYPTILINAVLFISLCAEIILKVTK